MKLEKIIINGTEYYQFVIISHTYPYKNTVLDIFEDHKDIPYYRNQAQLIINKSNK